MSALDSAAAGSDVRPHELNALRMAHSLGARDDGTLRIDLPPYGDADAVVAQGIDRVEEAGMHFHEVDRAEIGNDRHPATRDPRPRVGKTEATVDDRDFLCAFFDAKLRRTTMRAMLRS